jgi:hypothetical protein
MRGKSLVVLLVVLVAIAGAGIWKARRASAPSGAGPAAGGRLISFDINRVERFVVTGEGRTAEVARVGGTWALPSLFGYPARYDKIADGLVRLSDVKVGQTVPGGEAVLAELGLGEGATGGVGRIEFFGPDGSLLGRIEQGRARMTREGGPYGGYPDGQYVRVDGGPALLIASSLGDFSSSGGDWIEKKILDVPADRVVRVQAAVSNGAYRIEMGAGDVFTVAGLATNEQVDASAARRLRGALSYLNLETVADPALDDAATGLDAPQRLAFEASDGFSYAVRIGGTETNGGGRYARFAVSYQRPPEPARPAETPEPAPPAPADSSAAPAAATNAVSAGTNDVAAADAARKAHEAAVAKWREACEADEKKAAEQGAQLGKWVYVISSYSAGNFLIARDEVVKPVPPPAASTNDAVAATNAAPPAADGTVGAPAPASPAASP